MSTQQHGHLTEVKANWNGNEKAWKLAHQPVNISYVARAPKDGALLLLTHGVHYTTEGATLTFSFTPEADDSTQVSYAYASA